MAEASLQSRSNWFEIQNVSPKHSLEVSDPPKSFVMEPHPKKTRLAEHVLLGMCSSQITNMRFAASAGHTFT
jgi:hypothetical protein